jgi:hypothetical protein
MTRRKLGITAGTASGPNGLVRENHRRLTHFDDANLSPCAVNGGFKFPQREADMRMEAVCWERPNFIPLPSCSIVRGAFYVAVNWWAAQMKESHHRSFLGFYALPAVS